MPLTPGSESEVTVILIVWRRGGWRGLQQGREARWLGLVVDGWWGGRMLTRSLGTEAAMVGEVGADRRGTEGSAGGL